MTTISHDPFARQSLVRETVLLASANGNSCDECGCERRSFLYKYGYERDDRPYRPNWMNGLFCSANCMRAYHGIRGVA